MSIDTSRPNETGPIVIDGISYIPSSVLLTGIPKVSFKDNRAFAVVDPQGEAPRLYSSGAELGFYYNDTRYLGIWEMTFNGQSPVAFANELRFGGKHHCFLNDESRYSKGWRFGRPNSTGYFFNPKNSYILGRYPIRNSRN